MTAPDEPENGSCVVFRRGEFRELLRRDDDLAMERGCSGNWFPEHLADGVGRTWEQLTELGEIAYVGRFVDRRRVPRPKGEPWASQ